MNRADHVFNAMYRLTRIPFTLRFTLPSLLASLLTMGCVDSSSHAPGDDETTGIPSPTAATGS